MAWFASLLKRDENAVDREFFQLFMKQFVVQLAVSKREELGFKRIEGTVKRVLYHALEESYYDAKPKFLHAKLKLPIEVELLKKGGYHSEFISLVFEYLEESQAAFKKVYDRAQTIKEHNVLTRDDYLYEARWFGKAFGALFAAIEFGICSKYFRNAKARIKGYSQLFRHYVQTFHNNLIHKQKHWWSCDFIYLRIIFLKRLARDKNENGKLTPSQKEAFLMLKHTFNG